MKNVMKKQKKDKYYNFNENDEVTEEESENTD